MIDVNKLGKLVEEKGEDQSEATSGGGGFEQPAEGITWVRLIEYIERGKVKDVFKDRKTGKEVEKTVDRVTLGFELRGPLHPASNDETKREKPFIIRLNLNKSTNEKANFFKLFKKLRDAAGKPDCKHMVQLVGTAFKAVVYHKEGTGNSVGKTFANLHDQDGVYSFTAPERIVENEDGTVTKTTVKVPEAINPTRVFVWNLADKDQWDSLFIDGKSEDRTNDKGDLIPGKSKNWIQNSLKEADNFKGSKLEEIIGGVDELDVGDSVTPERDPLSEDGGTNKVEDDLSDDIPF